MKIVGIDGLPVKACCSFMYRGYTISASTIFHPHGVAVFKLFPDGVADRTMHSCDYIQSAIEWVDEQIEAAEHRDQPLIHPGADESFANQCEAGGNGIG